MVSDRSSAVMTCCPVSRDGWGVGVGAGSGGRVGAGVGEAWGVATEREPGRWGSGVTMAMTVATASLASAAASAATVAPLCNDRSALRNDRSRELGGGVWSRSSHAAKANKRLTGTSIFTRHPNPFIKYPGLLLMACRLPRQQAHDLRRELVGHLPDVCRGRLARGLGSTTMRAPGMPSEAARRLAARVKLLVMTLTEGTPADSVMTVSWRPTPCSCLNRRWRG